MFDGNGNNGEKGAMVKLCGLWENESAKGNYLSGYLGDAKVFIFVNKFKEPGSNQPDYTMHLAPKPRKKDDSLPDPDGSAGVEEAAAGGGPKDDIPF